MGVIEKIDDRSFAEEVFARAISFGDAKGDAGDGLGQGGSGGVNPDALLVGREQGCRSGWLRIERGKLKGAGGGWRVAGDGAGAEREGEFAELDGEFHGIFDLRFAIFDCVVRFGLPASALL